MGKAARAFPLNGAPGETLKLGQTGKEEEGLQGVRVAARRIILGEEVLAAEFYLLFLSP